MGIGLGMGWAWAGLHSAWAARGLWWPCSPESNAGSLRGPGRSAIVPLGKALQDLLRLVVDAHPTQPHARAALEGEGG